MTKVLRPILEEKAETSTRQRAQRPTISKPRKTAILVAQQIVDEITDKSLAPGAGLASERDMLEHYGISRGTLREALRILETYGLIAIKTGPGGGATVADAGSQPLASVISLVLQMDRTPVRSVLAAKVDLEPIMAREAAERRSQADLKILRDTIAEMSSKIDDSRAFAEQNGSFHVAVGSAANSPVLFNVLAALNWILDGTALRPDIAPQNREAILIAHRGIYRAIKSKSPDVAEAAMKVHARAFADHSERFYAHVLDSPVRWDEVLT